MIVKWHFTWQESFENSPPAHSVVCGNVLLTITPQESSHLLLSHILILISCNMRDDGPLKYLLPHPIKFIIRMRIVRKLKSRMLLWELYCRLTQNYYLPNATPMVSIIGLLPGRGKQICWTDSVYSKSFSSSKTAMSLTDLGWGSKLGWMNIFLTLRVCVNVVSNASCFRKSSFPITIYIWLAFRLGKTYVYIIIPQWVSKNESYVD